MSTLICSTAWRGDRIRASPFDLLQVLRYHRFDASGCGFPRPRVPVLPPLSLQQLAWRAPSPPSRARHFARGRYALKAAYELSGVGPNGALLAPAYHCRTMLDPAVRLRAEVALYPLTPELEPDLAASAPVLVALGTGFYPRWRATHASGIDEPVYAMRSTQTATLSVVSAWVKPGKTVFTVDGKLPSDGKGRVFAILAALGALAGIAVWSRARWRWKVLRRIVVLRRTLPASRKVATIGVPLVVVVLLARGCSEASGPVKALELGSGLTAAASVEARLSGGEWQRCDYQRLQGTYLCDGLLSAYDGITALLNDAMPSWGFNTPGLIASADVPGVEMRVTWRERVAGTYWTATTGDGVALDVNGEGTRYIDRTIVVYRDEGRRTIQLTAPIPTTTWQFTFVREDTLVPPRPYLAKPPDEPPP